MQRGLNARLVAGFYVSRIIAQRVKAPPVFVPDSLICFIPCILCKLNSGSVFRK